MRKIAFPVSVLGAVALATPIAAQDAPNWSPATYAELGEVIEASADAEGQPVYAITVDPDDFAGTIAEGYAAFLDENRRSSLAGAPDHVRDVYTRHEYFRDQVAPAGSGGGQDSATYRSAQVAYVVDCADRMIATNGFTLFARNNTDGRAVYIFEGTSNPAELVAEVPVPGSVGDFTVKAVCEGVFIYQQKD